MSDTAVRRSYVKLDSRRISRPVKARAPKSKLLLSCRLGELLLLVLFVSLLAGRFTLARVDDDAVEFDLRYLFVGVAVFGLMMWYSGAREHLPKRMPLTGIVPFTAWCAWLIVSAQWSPPGARSNEVATDMVFLFVLVVMSWFVMAHLPNESLDRVWTWLLVTGLIYFVLAIASGPDGQGRFAAPGGGPNTFVRIMVAAAIAALYLAVVKGKNSVLLAVPVFAIGAALSGSRGGILSAAVVLLVFLVPLVRRLGVGRTVGIGIIGAAGAVAAFYWRGGYVVQFIYERFIIQTLREGYSSGRDTITDQAWGMFSAHPIAGVGLDGYFALQLNTTGAFEHPHNLLVASLAEAGFVGGTLLVAAVLRLVFKALGRPTASGVLFALITGLYYFGTAMFSGDYYDSRFIWFFLGLAAIGASRARRGEERSLAAPSRQ